MCHVAPLQSGAVKSRVAPKFCYRGLTNLNLPHGMQCRQFLTNGVQNSVTHTKTYRTSEIKPLSICRRFRWRRSESTLSKCLRVDTPNDASFVRQLEFVWPRIKSLRNSDKFEAALKHAYPSASCSTSWIGLLFRRYRAR